MDPVPEIVWRILSEKGIQHNYKAWHSDPMPRPRRKFLVPTFDRATWEEMMRAIQEALEIWKAGVIEEAQEPTTSLC